MHDQTMFPICTLNKASNGEELFSKVPKTYSSCFLQYKLSRVSTSVTLRFKNKQISSYLQSYFFRDI